MDTILKLMTNLSRAEAGPAMDTSQVIPMPKSGADPGAVAEFSKLMNQPANHLRINGDTLTTTDIPMMPPQTETGYANPVTIGEKLEAAHSNAGQVPGMEQAETGSTKQWLNTITDILGSQTLSLPDLYRVQVLASMSQIETTRNSSVAKTMDDSLKTLIKNT
ncbi:MAG: hypothetical protein RBR67_07215 [Desulfobacterium sp.]|nr:hypothetical protein [Desulfobacterium sp.]